MNRPLWGIEPTTRACALPGNRICSHLVHRTTPSQPSQVASGTGVVVALNHSSPLDLPYFLRETGGGLCEPAGPRETLGPTPHGDETGLAPHSCCPVFSVRQALLLGSIIDPFLACFRWFLLPQFDPFIVHSGLSFCLFPRVELPSLYPPFWTQIWPAAFSASIFS